MNRSSLSVFLMLALVALTAPEAAAAQTVTAGDSVRVKMRGALALAGVAVEVQGERILLRTDGLAELWPVSMFEMSALHVLRARTKKEGFRHGFGMGLVSGLFIGAAVGLALHTTGVVGDEDDPPAELLMQTTLTSIGLGSLVGGFVGGFRGGSRPGYGWSEVRLPVLERQGRSFGR